MEMGSKNDINQRVAYSAVIYFRRFYSKLVMTWELELELDFIKFTHIWQLLPASTSLERSKK